MRQWLRFFQRQRRDDDLACEIESYLEHETAEQSTVEARYAAQKKLGNVVRIREEVYLMNSIGFVETLWHDLRQGVRVLRKSPGFTLIAILSLALGIGANTTVYSVINAVLMRSLPYPEPNRIVSVGQLGAPVNMAQLAFWKEHSATFASSAGYRSPGARFLTSANQTAWIQAMPVTSEFFRTLGVVPALGREFVAEEIRPGGPSGIVLTDGLWRRLLGGDPSVIGHLLKIDNTNYTVIGILPPSFWFPDAVDAFVPLRFTGSVGDMGTNTQMIARLKPGVSFNQAQAEMATLSESYRSTVAAYRSSVLSDLKNYRGLTITGFQDSLVGDVRTNLLFLFGAVGLLLLIACFNLASLLLARLATRQREIAMRVALGSSRGRLIQQFLIENTLVTMAGGLAGILGANALLDTLVASIPFNLPSSAPIRLDLPVLGFTLAIALATGVAFSLAPILTASRLDLQETLKAGGRSRGTTAQQRTRSFLVVSEVALSVTLLVAAALLIQSLYHMNQERLGFNPHGVITFSTPSTAQQRRNVAALRARDEALLERLRALPGVRSAAAANVLPLTGPNNFPAEREGHPDRSNGAMEILIVTPSYFETMGIPVIRGRPLNSSDTAASLPVILVNETVARTWWDGESPLGGRVAVGRFKGKDLTNGSEKPREVVGVVGDTKSVFLKAPPRPTVYLPTAQAGWYDSGMNWLLHGDFSAGFAEQLKRAVAEIDPSQRIDRIRSMDRIVASTTAGSQFNAWLFGVFAGLALLLAAIGVYGLLAFSVARRTNEIGTRMALGASPASVLKLILRQGIVLIVAGLGLGLLGALAVSHSLETLLFGVRSTDMRSFLSVSAILLSVGLIASYFPARRATKIDPMVALRD